MLRLINKEWCDEIYAVEPWAIYRNLAHVADTLLTQVPANRFASFRFSWAMTSAVYRDWSWRSRWTKCIARSLSSFLHHEEFSEWVGFLLQPSISPYAQFNDRIWQRPLRGYLSRAWNGPRKLKVLQDSYRFANAHSGPVQQALLQREFITIARVPLGPDLGMVEFALGNDQRFRREGEWALQVNCPQLGGNVCTIAFSVEEIDGQWVAYAGAIQGGAGANEATIKATAKAMHGVRAKAMAIFALQEVVSALGIQRLLGAGNTIQMSREKHLIAVPWNKISFNYDGMWQEADGQPAEDGWFALPLREIRRTREEIKPNKRPLYARRYALFDQLSAAVIQSLSSVGK